ncbi:4Fe-4S dicluster domain-containing protein [Chloroflexota bacterium]
MQQSSSAPGVAEASSGKGGGLSRRTFLKAGVGGGLFIAVGSRLIPFSQAMEEVKSDYVLIIDLNKCTGCGACEQACNQRNDLPDGKGFIRRIKKGEEVEGGCWCLPVQCQHCQDAPCEKVCPTKATYHHPSGAVLVNEKTCVGCKYCAVACPYDARTYDENTGVVDKCWLCLDWVLGGGQTACVQACVKGARIFGRRDDPEIAELLASGRVETLHPEFGTRPGVVHYIFRDS